MIRRRFAVVTVAVLLAASVVAAQNQPMTEVPSAPIAGWSFRPGIAIGALYDTNVVLTTALASTGSTPSDTLFTIEPVGELRFVDPRTTFGASYRGTIRRYTQLDGLDGYDQHAKARFERKATKRLTFFVQNEYSAVPTTDELQLNVPFTRAGSHSEALAGGLSYRLNERDTLTTRYDFTWVSFDRKAPELTGGVINGIHADVSHAFTKRMNAGTEGGYRFATMDELGGRELRFAEFGGTIGYDIDESTRVSGAAGYAHLQDLLFSTNNAGMYVRGSLTRHALRSLFGISYDRSFLPSFGFGGTNRAQQVLGWVDLPPIGHRVYMQASGAWRRTNPLQTGTELRLDTYQLRTSAGYAVSRWMRAEGFYLFTRQDSIVTGGEINRHRIGGEIVLSQPMRIR